MRQSRAELTTARDLV